MRLSDRSASRMGNFQILIVGADYIQERQRFAIWRVIWAKLKKTTAVLSTLSAAFVVLASIAVLRATAPFWLDQTSHSNGLFVLDFGISKVSICCVLLGFALLFKGPMTKLGFSEIVALIPVGICPLLISTNAVWVGLGISSLMLAQLSKRRSEARSGLLIIAMAALQQPASATIGMLFGGSILRVDQYFASLFVSLFAEVESTLGNQIVVANGYPIALVWQCGVFQNITLCILVWFSILRVSITRTNWIIVIDGAVLCLAIFSINCLRLGAMALDQQLFQFWHTGIGASLLRLSIVGISIVMAAWRVHRHVR